GEPAGTSAHDAVAGLDAAHAMADLDHLAGGIAAAGARLGCCLPGSNAQCAEPAEFRSVQRRRVYADQDVTRRDDGSLHVADIPAAAVHAGNHNRRLHAFLRLPGTPRAVRMRTG